MGSEGRIKPEEDLYTKYGTTDYKNSPANNAKQEPGRLALIFLGMTLLTLSASVPGIWPPCDAGVCRPSTMQSAVTFIALYTIAHGMGRIKPCVSSFGADQFDDTDEGEKKHKSSFFNWFYFSINIGALVAASVLVYIQTHVG